MRLTTAQVFQIGTILLTYAFAMAVFKFDPTTVGIVSAATLTAWNGVGLALTTPNAQANAVAAHLDDDEKVKKSVVQAVANLEGVEHIQLNTKATDGLAAMGASTEGVNSKIEPPK